MADYNTTTVRDCDEDQEATMPFAHDLSYNTNMFEFLALPSTKNYESRLREIEVSQLRQNGNQL